MSTPRTCFIKVDPRGYIEGDLRRQIRQSFVRFFSKFDGAGQDQIQHLLGINPNTFARLLRFSGEKPGISSENALLLAQYYAERVTLENPMGMDCVFVIQKAVQPTPSVSEPHSDELPFPAHADGPRLKLCSDAELVAELRSRLFGARGAHSFTMDENGDRLFVKQLRYVEEAL